MKDLTYTEERILNLLYQMFTDKGFNKFSLKIGKYDIVLKRSEFNNCVQFVVGKNAYDNEILFQIGAYQGQLDIISREFGCHTTSGDSVCIYRKLKGNSQWISRFTSSVSATSWIGVSKEINGIQQVKYVDYVKKDEIKYQKFSDGTLRCVGNPNYIYDGREDRLFAVTYDGIEQCEDNLEVKTKLRNVCQNYFPEISSWTMFSEEELSMIIEKTEEALEEKPKRKNNYKNFQKGYITTNKHHK